MVFIVLFAMSWDTLEPTEYGLVQNGFTGYVDLRPEAVYEGGRYFVWLVRGSLSHSAERAIGRRRPTHAPHALVTLMRAARLLACSPAPARPCARSATTSSCSRATGATSTLTTAAAVPPSRRARAPTRTTRRAVGSP